MLCLHEPARLIGADGNGGQVEAAETLADVLEVVRIAGVAAKNELKARSLDHPAAPQRLIAVVERARRPVLRRYEMEVEAETLGVVPPVVFLDIADALVDEPGFQAQRHQEQRRSARLTVQFGDGAKVEMVVMVMRNQPGDGAGL